MENILNLTQHPATAEQVAAGVVDVPARDSAALKGWLNFETLPTAQAVEEAAKQLAIIAQDKFCATAMIGGAPFLMAPLERALRSVGIEPVYAFSRRESVEETLRGGSVRKTAVFRHAGFVSAA